MDRKFMLKFTYNCVMGFIVGFTGMVAINKVVEKLTWE